jgi:hypothetical protein
LIERNQVTCFSVNHDLFNASCGAGEHWGAARHRLEVDDAKGLVDRWATEDAGIAVKLYCLLFRDHLFNPNDTRMSAPSILDLLSQLCGNFWRIRRASAKHYLGFPRQVTNCVHEMCHAFLSSDSADEQDVGNSRIDPIITQSTGLNGFSIFDQIDAVIDDMNSIGLHVWIGPQDVRSGAFGNSNDCVGIENRCPFHPGTHGIAAP